MNRNGNVLLVIALFAVVGLPAATYVFLTHSPSYKLFCPFATGYDAVPAADQNFHKARIETYGRWAHRMDWE
jgi:hypothetical protein